MRGIAVHSLRQAADHTRYQFCKRWFQSIPVIDVGPLVQGSQVQRNNESILITMFGQ